MRCIRTESPQPEKWEVEDVMAYLGRDETKANEIMENCRKANGIQGYGPIEKHLILDFINEKQRAEREREARHNADLATVRQLTALEEQVKILREMCKSSSEDARRARTQALVANFISGIAAAISIVALILKFV